MFLGVLVHSSHADLGSGDYGAIRFTSETFRMACFYMISGYFSLLVLEKLSFPDFLKRRSIMIVVPAILCVSLLVPITNNWMRIYYVENASELEYLTSWMGHAWFLVVLFFYTLTALPMLQCLKLSVRLLRSFLPLFLAQLGVIAGLVIVSIFAKKIASKILPSGANYTDLHFLAGAYFNFLPYFVIGLMMKFWLNVYHSIHQKIGLWFGLACLLIPLKYLLSNIKVTSFFDYFTVNLVTHCASICISFALFAAAVRLIKKPNKLIKVTSESAYTVYVFHYFFVAGVLLTAQRVGIDPWMQFILAFVSASALGVLIHFLLVQKLPLAAFICNGRMKPSPVTQQLSRNRSHALTGNPSRLQAARDYSGKDSTKSSTVPS